MFDHIGIFVTDTALSFPFFEKALAPLGILVRERQREWGSIVMSSEEWPLTLTDHEKIERGVTRAAERLDQVISGTLQLPNSLTLPMAKRLRAKFESGITIHCASCHPICWFADGLAVPATDVIMLCAQKIKNQNGQSASNVMVLIVLHETVHLCGKVGHKPPDNPYEWAAWLTVLLPK
jgi:hypothetical protein